MARQTIFSDQTPMQPEADTDRSCKTAQAPKEVRQNYRTFAWDNSTDLQPVQHAERPRYGKAM
jgi:hypothetical protein